MRSALNMCRHMYTPDMCRYMHTLSQLLIRAHIRSAPDTFRYIHTHTRSAIDTCRHMHTHTHTQTQPGILANTCSAMRMKMHDQLSKHANKHSALKGTCRHTLSSRHRKLNDGARSDLETCQQTPLAAHVDNSTGYMQKHAYTCSPLDSDHGNADTHSSLSKSKQMQKHAQLLIRAGTCTNMPSLGYVHAHAGIQCVHVHA
jgi:hypothetical protein